ncbi:MAG: hypothetical protein ACXIUM_00680 [Wenzhouxiangella sp.]
MNESITAWSAAVLLTLVLAADPASAQGRLDIGAGAILDTGGGRIESGCASLVLHGKIAGRWSGLDSVLLGASGRLATRELEFGGDWHSETEQSVPGQIHWRQQCGRSEGSLSGSHRFTHLLLSGDSAVTRKLAIENEQWVDQSLRLQGGSERLALRSSAPGTLARLTLAPDASWQVARVEVADIDSSGGQTIAPGDPTLYDSRDGGGNRNWFSALAAAPIPVPTLGPAALLALIVLILLTAGRFRVLCKPCCDPEGGSA